jgi:hypothetical protein
MSLATARARVLACTVAIGWPRAVGAMIIATYYWMFVSQGLAARFAADDMMAIHTYWSPGPGLLLRGLLLFFSTYIRPMGGVYYSVLFHFFGLNPFPYHVTIMVVILLNTCLAYRLVRQISGSELAAFFAAFVVTYHSQMAQAVFMNSFIFDVLCFFFWVLALSFYVSIRTTGAQLRRWQMLAFLLLYITALNSKEMAVSLPVMVLLYELLWHRPARWNPPSLLRWARSEALPALVGGLLTAIYILGKTLGAGSLANTPEYQSQYTWSRYMDSTTTFVNTLTYGPPHDGFFTPAMVLMLLVAVLAFAVLSREKYLVWTFCLILITPLPITFIPDRGGICLYIPLLGWAMLAAAAILGVANILARLPLVCMVPRDALRAAAVLLGIAAIWRTVALQNSYIAPAELREGDLTWSVIHQVHEVQPTVPPGSKLYFTNDVFAYSDTKFIAELTYRDHSVTAWLDHPTPLSPDEIAGMDYVFTFENGRLKRVKPPPIR